MDDPAKFVDQFSRQGPLWALFLVWIFFTLYYVPPLLKAHLDLVSNLRESLVRFAAAYEELSRHIRGLPPSPPRDK